MHRLDSRGGVIANAGVTFDRWPHGLLHMGQMQTSSPEVQAELDELRGNLVKTAAGFYVRECDGGAADYTVHDALYDASRKLRIIPDEWFDDDKNGKAGEFYEDMIFDIRRDLGID
jgi:hypothetical protein